MSNRIRALLSDVWAERGASIAGSVVSVAVAMVGIHGWGRRDGKIMFDSDGRRKD